MQTTDSLKVVYVVFRLTFFSDSFLSNLYIRTISQAAFIHSKSTKSTIRLLEKHENMFKSNNKD